MGTDAPSGTELAGYRIERLLGRGGMSVVYLAEDRRLKRRVALKVIAPELAQDELFRQRFVRESELAASLDHPNIVPIYEAGEADGVLFIAMRYVEGIDLKALIERDGPLDPQRAVAILRQVAGALDAAHARGLVHRDVKSSNILIATGAGEEEHAYLSDFGLTKRSTSDSGALTGTGQFLGTVDYAAPEQFQRGKLDGRVDQYSLGCVAYECLVGEVPFPTELEVATMYAHLNEAPPKPSEHRADLPKAVDDIVARVLAKDPAARYGSCREFVSALAGAVASGAADVPASPAADSSRPGQRRWTSLAVGLVLAAVVVAGVLIATLHHRATTTPSSTASGQSSSPSSSPPSSPPPGVITSPSPTFAVHPANVMKIDPDTGQPLTQYPAGGTDFVVFANGKLFIDRRDQTIAVIDPGTGKLVKSIAGLVQPLSPAVFDGDHTLWVETYRSITPVNVDTLKAGLPIPVPIWPCSHDVIGDTLWVAGQCPPGRRGSNPAEAHPVLLQIDLHSKKVVRRFPVGHFPLAMAHGDGFLWVASYDTGNLSQVDLATGKASTLNVASSPNGLAFADGELWISNYGDSTVIEYDPVLRQTVNVVHLDSQPYQPAVGFGHVWVPLVDYEEVDEIDQRSGAIVAKISTGLAQPNWVTVGDGAVWTTLGPV